jgi:catechol 2,3-dioxygenase-like lactoylglutathione lyase family enzyme
VVAADKAIASRGASPIDVPIRPRYTPLPMTIKSLAHVCIKSSDLAATAEFYCGALGMKRLFDFTRKGKVIGFYMKAQNTTFVEVFLESEVLPIDRHKMVLSHFCLETDDIKALHASLVARGLKVGPIVMGADQAQQFWMDDPNGLAVEFQEYAENCSQFTGRSVEATW